MRRCALPQWDQLCIPNNQIATRRWVMGLSPSLNSAGNQGFILYLAVYNENRIIRVG
jgi:hypothetical protein